MILNGEKAWLRLTPTSAGPGGAATIELEVSSEQGAWSVSDPGLHRNDLRAIARWLRSLGRGHRAKALDFTEPNVRFECLSTGEVVRIRVWFEGEARPSWAPYTHWSMQDLSVDLDVSHSELVEAAETLREELDRIESSRS